MCGDVGIFSELQTFFQLIAGINFAFAVSNKFNILLYDKVVWSIKDVRKKYKDLQDKIRVTKESVWSAPIAKNDNLGREEIHQEIINTLNEYDENNEIGIIEIDAFIINRSRTNFFMLICFYTGLYSLIILLYDAFNFMSTEQLFLFNSISILFFIILFIFELNKKITIIDNDLYIAIFKNKRRINFLTFFKMFLFISLFSFVSILFLDYYYKKCSVNIDFSVKLSSIILPSMHFIWYFILALYNSQLISKSKLKEINEDINKFEKFESERVKPSIFIALEIERGLKNNLK